MDTLAENATGTGISLEQVLAAREQRVARQSAALTRFGKPVVSMTVVMPGPEKDGPLQRRVMEVALQELNGLERTCYWPVLSSEVWWQETGPEAIWVVAVEPSILKTATVELEDQHPLGRLWDLDVIAPGQGGLSRRGLALPPRRCLACDRPAFECSRSRRHALPELLNIIHNIVRRYEQCAVKQDGGNRVCAGN